MAGGLIQLIAVGQIDTFLSINPQLSFYQYVYKRHSYFAMESRRLEFSTQPSLNNQVYSSFECVVGRHGDLLSEIYFCFTLPNIYSSNKYRFKWIKQIGNIFVKKATIKVGDIEIDSLTGEWMHIWNELSLPENDKRTDEMLGNVQELYDPKLSHNRVTIRNNQFIYYYYPESSPSTTDVQPPSIKSREIIVPLRFWFTKNPALSLPLLRLQGHEIKIYIETEKVENLYQVYVDDLKCYVSPWFFNNRLYPNNKIEFRNFVKNEASFAIQPYIEANYILLDQEERYTLFRKGTLSYLVEQLKVQNVELQNIESMKTVDISVNLPTKEIIWTIKRNDVNLFNEWTNYTMDIPESNRGILKSGQIIFNNNARTDEKPAQYFNIIQTYKYHTRVPKQGIYCYSFALFPEKEFISGYYNACIIKSSLLVYLNADNNNIVFNNLLSKKFNITEPNINYNMNIYCSCYNMFEIIGNQVSMKFTISRG